VTHLADLVRLLHHPALADPRILKVTGLVFGGLGAAGFTHWLVRKPTSLLSRALSAYAHYLDRRFRSLFLQANVKAVILTQAISFYAIVAAGIAFHEVQIAPFALLVAALPVLLLELKHRKRILAIETQTDGFILALSNALKATPSVGDAFISLIPIVSEPLRSEVDLATKQMRLGQTLEDALLMMATRIGSRVFDTALASVLIGQRVGGNLPKILETSASALRELFRLEGMMRSRTAAGRIQLWVIAFAPVLFVFYFDQTQPGYFDPLTTSTTGMLMLFAAVVLWMLAIVLGRKILRVDV
jgi:tight adherence protein B